MGEYSIMNAKPTGATAPPPALISLCGKMDVLDAMLLKLKAQGHKVCAFVCVKCEGQVSYQVRPV